MSADLRARNARRREIDGLHYAFLEVIDVLCRRADSLERLAQRNARQGKTQGHQSKIARAAGIRRCVALLADGRLLALAQQDEPLGDILLSLPVFDPRRPSGRNAGSPPRLGQRETTRVRLP